MQLLNQSADHKAFNSSLASLAKKPPLPNWFPKPYLAHADLEIYISKKELKGQEDLTNLLVSAVRDLPHRRQSGDRQDTLEVSPHVLPSYLRPSPLSP